MLRAWVLAASTFCVVAHGCEGLEQVEGRRLEASDQPKVQIQPRAEPTSANPETLAWIKRNAIPLKGVEAGKGFADMQPLKAVVGDATVVGLGEATHGTREFFQLKHRMLEFLATEMGFTVFAIEANLPEAFAVNDYVLTGKGDPAKALAGLYFWTWNTEEVLDLIRWMRAYNADPQHAKKLRFYGVDMQTETVAMAQAKSWLEGADPDEAAHLGAIKDRVLKLRSRNLEIPATENDRLSWDAVARDVEAMILRLESRKFPGDDFDRQRQNLRVLVQFATKHVDPMGGYGVRDASMADNLRWIQAREQGAKVVLWAHNGHITRRPGARMGGNSLGWHLRQSLGKAYLPIAFAFSEGTFQAMGDRLEVFEVKPQARGTLDAALAATGYPVLALDLRKRPVKGSVTSWLESPQGTWSIGARFSPDHAGWVMQEAITEAYDALLFVNHTTSARPVRSGSLEQLAKAIGLKEPVNLDFKNGLMGWSLLRGNSEGYTARIVNPGVKETDSYLQVVFEGASRAKLQWAASQTLDATSYRGKRVRLSGRIRTDGRPDSKAVFWLRVYCSSGKGFLDKMKDRPVTNTEWTEVTLEGPVAEDAVILDFGCMAIGIGTAWFDGIRVEVLP